jgi:hypothetical protein
MRAKTDIVSWYSSLLLLNVRYCCILSSLFSSCCFQNSEPTFNLSNEMTDNGGRLQVTEAVIPPLKRILTHGNRTSFLRGFNKEKPH